jgi:hypothetical protein
LLKNHPELSSSLSEKVYYVDTIVSVDTFVTPADTIEVLNRDTIIDTKENTIYITREKIRIINKADTIISHDTTIKEVRGPVIKVDSTKRTHSFAYGIAFGVLICFVICLLLFGLFKIIK